MGRPRRNEPIILDQLSEHIKLSPLWLGPLLALMQFAACMWGIPWLLSAQAGTNEGKQAMSKVLNTVSVGIAPFVAGAVLFV